MPTVDAIPCRRFVAKSAIAMAMCGKTLSSLDADDVDVAVGKRQLWRRQTLRQCPNWLIKAQQNRAD